MYPIFYSIQLQFFTNTRFGLELNMNMLCKLMITLVLSSLCHGTYFIYQIELFITNSTRSRPGKSRKCAIQTDPGPDQRLLGPVWGAWSLWRRMLRLVLWANLFGRLLLVEEGRRPNQAVLSMFTSAVLNDPWFTFFISTCCFFIELSTWSIKHGTHSLS